MGFAAVTRSASQGSCISIPSGASPSQPAAGFANLTLLAISFHRRPPEIRVSLQLWRQQVLPSTPASRRQLLATGLGRGCRAARGSRGFFWGGQRKALSARTSLDKCWARELPSKENPDAAVTLP